MCHGIWYTEFLLIVICSYCGNQYMTLPSKCEWAFTGIQLFIYFFFTVTCHIYQFILFKKRASKKQKIWLLPHSQCTPCMLHPLPFPSLTSLPGPSNGQELQVTMNDQEKQVVMYLFSPIECSSYVFIFPKIEKKNSNAIPGPCES